MSRDGHLALGPDHALHDRYAAQSPCLYLIRPDGYIGYRARPPDGDALLQYLAQTLGLTAALDKSPRPGA
ncbi:MAG: hypothetical protein JO250_07385 [Armatimonadetes bacterium]|nr:hypothetical protein [Armatimonadota bacterium]